MEKDLAHKYALLTLINRWEFSLDKQGFSGALLKIYFYFIDDL